MKPKLTKLEIGIFIRPVEDNQGTDYDGVYLEEAKVFLEEEIGDQDRRLVAIVKDKIPELLEELAIKIEFGGIAKRWDVE